MSGKQRNPIHGNRRQASIVPQLEAVIKVVNGRVGGGAVDEF